MTCGHDDTITGHATLGPPRGVPQRMAAQAFQAECRGFETRLPLQNSGIYECTDTHRNLRESHFPAALPPSSGSRNGPTTARASSSVPAIDKSDQPASAAYPGSHRPRSGTTKLWGSRRLRRSASDVSAVV